MGNTSSQGAFSIAMLVYRSAVKKNVKHFPAMDIKKKVEKTTTTHILTHFGWFIGSSFLNDSIFGSPAFLACEKGNIHPFFWTVMR